MTDTELDQRLRRALLEAVQADEEQAADQPVFSPSPRYRRSMRAMVRDPLGWLRARERPVWKRALRQAAAVLLVLSIGFGCVMAAVPSARAAVLRWFAEWNETRITFYYSGDEIAHRPDFVLTALPEGYEEIQRDDLGHQIVSIVYGDSSGNVLSFRYIFMEAGGLMGFDITDEQIMEVTVNGMDGMCLVTPEPDVFNTLTWIDEERGVQFDLSGLFSPEELVEMAESVVPLD